MAPLWSYAYTYRELSLKALGLVLLVNLSNHKILILWDFVEPSNLPDPRVYKFTCILWPPTLCKKAQPMLENTH